MVMCANCAKADLPYLTNTHWAARAHTPAALVSRQAALYQARGRRLDLPYPRPTARRSAHLHHVRLQAGDALGHARDVRLHSRHARERLAGARQRARAWRRGPPPAAGCACALPGLAAGAWAAARGAAAPPESATASSITPCSSAMSLWPRHAHTRTPHDLAAAAQAGRRFRGTRHTSPVTLR